MLIHIYNLPLFRAEWNSSGYKRLPEDGGEGAVLYYTQLAALRYTLRVRLAHYQRIACKFNMSPCQTHIIKTGQSFSLSLPKTHCGSDCKTLAHVLVMWLCFAKLHPINLFTAVFVNGR